MDVEDNKLAIDMATVRNMNGAPLRRRGIAIFRMYERIHLNKVGDPNSACTLENKQEIEDE